jgi:hypothetical protein
MAKTRFLTWIPAQPVYETRRVWSAEQQGLLRHAAFFFFATKLDSEPSLGFRRHKEGVIAGAAGAEYIFSLQNLRDFILEDAKNPERPSQKLRLFARLDHWMFFIPETMRRAFLYEWLDERDFLRAEGRSKAYVNWILISQLFLLAVGACRNSFGALVVWVVKRLGLGAG